MKTLLTLLSLSIPLALAGVAVGQINHAHNEVGIYAVPDPEGCASAQVGAAPWTPFTCYLVLTNLWNEDLDRPVTTFGGAEFRLGIPPDGLVLGAVLPPRSTDGPDLPDFAFGASIPVVDAAVVVVTFTLLTTSTDPRMLFLTPTESWPPSIPGHMIFTDYDDGFSMQIMHPVSGSFDVPVFAINWDGELSFCETVPDEGMSFGSLKALYR